MNRTFALKEAMTEALRATEDAATLGGSLSSRDLLRGVVAKRLSDAHERLVREAKTLADEAGTLVATLQCDGIGARVGAQTFARTARRVSGALIRLTESRETFEALHAQDQVAGLLPRAPALPSAGEASTDGDDTED